MVAWSWQGPGGNFLDYNHQTCSRGPSGRRPPAFKHQGRYKQEAEAEVREEDNTDTHRDAVGSKVDTPGTPVHSGGGSEEEVASLCNKFEKETMSVLLLLLCHNTKL